MWGLRRWRRLGARRGFGSGMLLGGVWYVLIPFVVGLLLYGGVEILVKGLEVDMGWWLRKQISLGDQSNYYITTAKNELGVIMARSEAGNVMVPVSWREFRDLVVGGVESRKVAKPFWGGKGRGLGRRGVWGGGRDEVLRWERVGRGIWETGLVEMVCNQRSIEEVRLTRLKVSSVLLAILSKDIHLSRHYCSFIPPPPP